jgi:MFS family permease
MPEPSLESARSDPRPRTHWLALMILLAGTILSPVDFFVVNVALPSIRTDLHASSAGLQLVVGGYSCAYAVLLITGGRLGDLYGRRRVFVLGLVGFGCASALSGGAWSPTVLVCSRVAQGAFAAMVMPQSLAYIRASIPPTDRPRALAAYGATFGLGAVIGQSLGGILIAADPFGLSWRAIFLINLPIVAIVTPLACMRLRESREPTPPDVDYLGVTLLGAGLSALIVPLVLGRQYGWPIWAWVLLVVSGPLLTGFWRWEHHEAVRGRVPLIAPEMFTAPGIKRWVIVVLLFNAFAAFFLVFSVYEQAGRGADPLVTGLAVLPLGVGFVLSPFAGPRLARRLDERTAAVGMGLVACGMFATAGLGRAGVGWAMTPALLVIGLGQGITLPALAQAVVGRAETQFAGTAAGVVNSALQISGTLGVAAIGSIFFSLTGTNSRDDVKTAFAAAVGLIALAALSAAGLSLWHEPRRRVGVSTIGMEQR